jgi:signal transduction histidine kinase
MRTPMSTVIGLSNFGIEENRDKQDVNYFNQIKESSEYLLGLLNDILDMQK